MAPVEYDKYLKNIYGDYMRLPSIEERVTLHKCSVIDLNNSYKCYIGG